jgi:heat shock protein HslJ
MARFIHRRLSMMKTFDRRTARFSFVFAGALALVACGGEAADEAAPPAAEPEPAVNAESLVGSWTLVMIDMEDGEDFEPAADAVPNLNFTAEANPTGSRIFNGSGGCNRMMGGYDAGTTGRITFTAGPAMTMMACPDEIMRVEQVFAMGLEAARTYSIEEARLSIDFGGGVLHFERDEG